MNNQNAFYDDVLGRVADDYEAPHTIAGDLSRDLGREVTEQAVLEALLSLAKSGLVQAYLNDDVSHQFVPVNIDAMVPLNLLWFMAPRLSE